MCQIQKSQKSAIWLHPNVLVPTAARAGKAAMCQIQKSQKVLYHSTLMFSFLQRPELGWYTVSLSFMACNQAQLGFPPYNVVISRRLKKMYVVFSEAMRIFLQKCNISAKPSFFAWGRGLFLYPEILLYYTMILQDIRIIVEYVDCEPGTAVSSQLGALQIFLLMLFSRSCK